jgi:hypothetical protein
MAVVCVLVVVSVALYNAFDDVWVLLMCHWELSCLARLNIYSGERWVGEPSHLIPSPHQSMRFRYRRR